MSDLSPAGTIAFVKDEERLYARVTDGWKPLLVLTIKYFIILP